MKRVNKLTRAISFVLVLVMALPLFTGAAQAQTGKVRVGDIITFGSYEQDDIYMNGTEPIEWYVLYTVDSRALLISRYCLFASPFSEDWSRLTWDKCALRDYLNDDFYYEAFSSSERNAILRSKVVQEKNPVYRTSAGEDTMDNVFLLSYSEAERYLRTDTLLRGIPTQRCIADGATATRKNGLCWYWLRTPGRYRTDVTYVTTDQVVDMHINGKGVQIIHKDGAVRPCIWVDLAMIS